MGNFSEWLMRKDEAFGQADQYTPPRGYNPPAGQHAQAVTSFLSKSPDQLSTNEIEVRRLWDTSRGFLNAYREIRNPKIKEFFGPVVSMLTGRLNAMTAAHLPQL